MTRGGLLVEGAIVPVEGVEIDNPNTATWCKLGPEDYRTRRERVVAIVLHTTKGIWPQHVIPGAGPGGKDEDVANYWRLSGEGKKRSSATPIVVDTDGTAGCLADVVRAAGHHATTANPYTLGIEMYQLANGGIYEATLATTVRITRALCAALSIPWQIAIDTYSGGPVARIANDGRSVYGIYGHREQTNDRGHGDPGDPIVNEHVLAGCEGFRMGRGEDLEAWERRQRKLNAMGEKLTVDGLAGPSTILAMRRHGFASGRQIDAAVEAQ